MINGRIIWDTSKVLVLHNVTNYQRTFEEDRYDNFSASWKHEAISFGEQQIVKLTLQRVTLAQAYKMLAWWSWARRGQEFSFNMLPGEAVEDETGASWGPQYHGLSLADDQAFLRVQGVDLSTFATAGATYMVRFFDSSENEAFGFIADADATEALGSNLAPTACCTDPSNDQNTTSGWSAGYSALLSSISGGETGYCLEIKENGQDFPYATKALTLTAGKLYKITFSVKEGTEATYRVYVTVGGTVYHNGTGDAEATGSWVSHSFYFTAWQSSISFVLMNRSTQGSGTTVLFDNVSIREVTHAGIDAVHVVSAKGETTRNWARIDNAFNYNDSAYTLEVLEVPDTTLDSSAVAGQKTIPLTSTPFQAGDYALIKEANGDNYEVVQIASVSAGVSVTLEENLIHSYASGDIFRKLNYFPTLIMKPTKFDLALPGPGQYYDLDLEFQEVKP